MADTFTINQSPASVNLFLYPTGDDVVALTPIGETNNYECVDDVFGAYNEDTDYVYTDGTLEVEDVYTLQDHGSETGTINYVEVFARAKTYPVNQHANGIYKILAYIAGGTYYSDSFDIMLGYQMFSNLWADNPASSTAWSWADIDNLKIGIRANSPTLTDETLTYLLRTTTEGDTIEWLLSFGDPDHAVCVRLDDGQSVYDYSVNIERRDIYNFQGTSTMGALAKGTIDKIVSYVNVRSTGSPPQTRKARFVQKDYGTVLTGSWFTPPWIGTWFSKEWTATGTAGELTWDALDQTQFGLDAEQDPSPVNTLSMAEFYIVVHYHTDINPEIRTTQCYALVNYTPPATTVTITKPKAISDSYGHKIGKFSFADGDYRIDDFGVSHKTIVLSGTQVPDAASKLEEIKQMGRRGDKVTVDGLDDSELNDDYIVRSVRKSAAGVSGSGLVYDWEIVLEKTN